MCCNFMSRPARLRPGERSSRLRARGRPAGCGRAARVFRSRPGLCVGRAASWLRSVSNAGTLAAGSCGSNWAMASSASVPISAPPGTRPQVVSTPSMMSWSPARRRGVETTRTSVRRRRRRRRSCRNPGSCASPGCARRFAKRLAGDRVVAADRRSRTSALIAPPPPRPKPPAVPEDAFGLPGVSCRVGREKPWDRRQA